MRFLPQYDNALLSHADRSRFATRDVSEIWTGRTGSVGSVLADGVFRGMWRFDGPFREVVAGTPSVLTVTVADLAKGESGAITAEAKRLAEFVHARVDDVRVVRA